MSWMLSDPEDSPLVGQIKNAVAIEYIPVSEYCEMGKLNILLRKKDSFEWIDVEDAIPIDSDREYPEENATKLAAIKR